MIQGKLLLLLLLLHDVVDSHKPPCAHRHHFVEQQGFAIISRCWLRRSRPTSTSSCRAAPRDSARRSCTRASQRSRAAIHRLTRKSRKMPRVSIHQCVLPKGFFSPGFRLAGMDIINFRKHQIWWQWHAFGRVGNGMANVLSYYLPMCIAQVFLVTSTGVWQSDYRQMDRW